MISSNASKQKGFIALMSAIIISAVLLMLLFSVNTASFYARFDALDGEFKKIAESSAEACGNVALVRLAENYSYDPIIDPVYILGEGVPIEVGNSNCFIKKITSASHRTGTSSDLEIITQGVHHNAYSNLKISVTIYNSKISSPFNPPSNIVINSLSEIEKIE